MGLVRRFLIVAVAMLAWYIAHQLNTVPPVPTLDPNPWWGHGEPRAQNTAIRPFRVNISNEDLEDLTARLSLPLRLTPSLEETGFAYGVNSVALSVILKYWKDSYDWRKREQKLNSFSHFKTRIEGLDIHFMRSSPPAGTTKIVRPLLMLHGWPGSFVEFYDIIPLLTKPRHDSDVVFDVICPSLPGYGFSDGATKPGMNPLAMSQVFVKLMKRLGYEEFYAHGGDWGAVTITDMAVAFPYNLLGIHITTVFANTPGATAKMFLGSILPSGYIMEAKFEPYWYPLSNFYGMILREMGYLHLHATKPDTVGVALNSSPQGLAAYILEKFSTWTNLENIDKKDGGLLDPDFPIRLDSILDNICIYWFSSSITTSMRLYAEFFDPSGPSYTLKNIPVKVATGIASFSNDLVVTPKNFAAYKYKNIVTFSTPPRGGHFAAMEEPELVADDIHHFVNKNERLRPNESQQTKDKTGAQKKEPSKAGPTKQKPAKKA